MDTEMDNETMGVCLTMNQCHMADDGKQSMTDDGEVVGIRVEHFGKKSVKEVSNSKMLIIINTLKGMQRRSMYGISIGFKF